MPPTLQLDPYIHTTLLRDLVGHDHSPAAFLVYLWISLEQQRLNAPVAASYTQLAEETGLSRSTAQTAIAWLLGRELLTVERASVTATPIYQALAPWRRIPGPRKVANP